MLSLARGFLQAYGEHRRSRERCSGRATSGQEHHLASYAHFEIPRQGRSHAPSSQIAVGPRAVRGTECGEKRRADSRVPLDRTIVGESTSDLVGEEAG